MDYTFDINIEIEDCINEYKKYFKIEETEETIYKVLLNEKELLEESQKYANKITKTNTSEEKFSIGALIMYGYRIGAYIERNKSVCLERQNGYKSTPIYSYNVDSILNVKTISEDASLDELVNWIINPGSNLEIVDEVFKQMVSPVVKMLSRITPQNKKINLQLFIPPFSKLIEFNKWNELLSKYFDNKTEISIMNYGSLLELEKNKRSYIIMYTGENENSKIIISAYELLRGKPLCLGTLAFDLYSNNIFELHNVNEYTFEKDETHQELIRKNNAIEVKDVLKPLKLNYEKIIGYKSFLANHPSGFYDERFQYTEEDDELNPVLDSIKLYQSISPIDVCIKNINETNINHISLGDVMYISDIMEKNPCFKKQTSEQKEKLT